MTRNSPSGKGGTNIFGDRSSGQGSIAQGGSTQSSQGTRTVAVPAMTAPQIQRALDHAAQMGPREYALIKSLAVGSPSSITGPMDVISNVLAIVKQVTGA